MAPALASPAARFDRALLPALLAAVSYVQDYATSPYVVASGRCVTTPPRGPLDRIITRPQMGSRPRPVAANVVKADSVAFWRASGLQEWIDIARFATRVAMVAPRAPPG
jgi:hypothetical protein